MNVAVTGGAGFIGSHLVDRLVSKNNNVVVIDNLSSGKREYVNNKAEFVKIAVQSPHLRQIFRERKFDIIFHLAAQASVSGSKSNPLGDAKTNIFGTLNILKFASLHKVKKIVFAHSVASFGEPKYLPIDEKHPVGPISFYGLSKYAGSSYVELFGNFHNLPYVIGIFANVYGPRQNHQGEGGVVSIFSYQMLNKIRPKIYGNGKQTRDFIYVSDLSDALISFKKAKNEVFTIGTGKEITINDLYKKIAMMTNFKHPPIYAKKKEGDILRSVLSTKKTKKILDFSPKVKLHEGLKKTTEYFKKMYT